MIVKTIIAFLIIQSIYTTIPCPTTCPNATACNANGFCIISIATSDTPNNLTEGAITGLFFGWFFGMIIFYVLGILLIRYLLSRKGE